MGKKHRSAIPGLTGLTRTRSTERGSIKGEASVDPFNASAAAGEGSSVISRKMRALKDSAGSLGSLRRIGVDQLRNPSGQAAGQLLHVRSVGILYLAVGALLAAVWVTLTVEINPPRFAAVWVRFCPNETVSGTYNASLGADGSPSSLRLKVLSVYLAEDVNITDHTPIYGARRYTSQIKPETGPAPIAPRGDTTGRSLISNAQMARRIWTHPACDPDGDGLIGDCDISAPWKYNQLNDQWLDLATDPADPTDASRANPSNPLRHEVPAGRYHFVVVQTCLENLDGAPMFGVRGGGDMLQHYEWGGANSSATPHASCFRLTRPLAVPLDVEHGADYVISLQYSLHGTFRKRPLGSELKEEWECFLVDSAADEVPSRHCARLPALHPVVHRRGDLERFSLSMVPPRHMCADFRYLQALAVFQEADADGDDRIYRDELRRLGQSLQDIGILLTGGIGAVDEDGDRKITFHEFTNWLGRLGVRSDTGAVPVG